MKRSNDWQKFEDYIAEELKVIDKIISVPIPFIKDNKLIFPKRGYNADNKLFLNYNSPEITEPDMSVNEAKKILYDMLKDFCFKNDDDCVKNTANALNPISLIFICLFFPVLLSVSFDKRSCKYSIPS